MAKAEPRSITRRSLVAALTLPFAPVLAVAPPPVPAAPVLPPRAPDPVFALIDAHIRAYNELITVLDALAVAETEAWHAPRGQRRAAKKRLADAYTAERRFGGFENDAFGRLVATVPQTLQGAAAALRYVRGRSEQGDCIDEEDYIALLGSIECAISKTACVPVPAADR